MKPFAAFMAAIAAPSVLGAAFLRLINATNAIDVYPVRGPWTDALNLVHPEPSNPVEPADSGVLFGTSRSMANPSLPPSFPWLGGEPGDWADPYGNVSYGYFSIITLLERKGQAVTVIYGQHTTAMMYPIRCHGRPRKGEKGWWNDLHSWLPWTVAIHSSTNWCNPDSGDENLWIKYANQHVNVPDDIRCENTVAYANDPIGNVLWLPRRGPNSKGE